MAALTPILIFLIVLVGSYILLTTLFVADGRGRAGLEGLKTVPKGVPSPAAPWSDDLRARLAEATHSLRRFDLYRSTDLALLRAGWSLHPAEFGLAASLAALVAGLAGRAATGQALAGAAAAAVVLALAPVLLKAASQGRMARFEAQLPDALDLMAASLRAGHGFQRALQVTAQDMPRPVADEFEAAVRDIASGRTVEEALHGVLQRVPSYEMELIATAVGIQMQVGGNLSEVLVKIAETLRERARIKGEIATLTAEGRFSAWILLLAPMFVLVFMLNRSPEYMAPLMQEQTGRMMLVGAGLLQAVGMVIIWRMLAMEV